MTLSPLQKKIVGAGLVIVAGLVLFPPWNDGGYSAGYHWIASPPQSMTGKPVAIDYARWLVPVFFVAVAAGVAAWLAKAPGWPSRSSNLSGDLDQIDDEPDDRITRKGR